MNEQRKILIVEDDESISNTLKLILSESNQVITASNGTTALEAIKKEGMPKLILLDMRMPVMDGWQFSKEFHRIYGHSAPIVVMTAAADASKRAQDVEAEAWMGKPFDLENLFDLVHKYVGN